MIYVRVFCFYCMKLAFVEVRQATRLLFKVVLNKSFLENLNKFKLNFGIFILHFFYSNKYSFMDLMVCLYRVVKIICLLPITLCLEQLRL